MEANFKVALGMCLFVVVLLSLIFVGILYEQHQTNECRIESSKTHSAEDAKSLCR